MLIVAFWKKVTKICQTDFRRRLSRANVTKCSGRETKYLRLARTTKGVVADSWNVKMKSYWKILHCMACHKSRTKTTHPIRIDQQSSLNQLVYTILLSGIKFVSHVFTDRELKWKLEYFTVAFVATMGTSFRLPLRLNILWNHDRKLFHVLNNAKKHTVLYIL